MGLLRKKEYLYTLSFAGDQVLIAPIPEDLSNLMRKLQEEDSQAGLEINFAEMEYLATIVEFLQINDNITIEEKSKNKYLGFIILKKAETDK